MFRAVSSCPLLQALPSQKTWRELTVLDLLEGEVSIQPIQPKNKEVCTFIASNCPELIDYAFSDP
jgi:hypothetical protein